MKVLLVIIFIVSTKAMAVVPAAKAATAKAATKAAEPAKVERRNYSEEEFKKAVLVEVEKTMKRAGSGNLIEFSKELLDKEEQLKVKELEIQKGQDQLKLNQADFQKKVVEFQESQKKFLGCVDAQNEKAEKRVGQMVEVISGMKPQNAAEVLSVQDPDLSVRILAQLDTLKASKIFNLMDKEVSARLQKQFLLMKK
jgi:flagellar motility protein MotE (MotC chaperone)